MYVYILKEKRKQNNLCWKFSAEAYYVPKTLNEVHSSLGWHIFFFISSNFSPEVRLFNFYVNMILKVPEFLFNKAVDPTYHIQLNVVGDGLLVAVVIAHSESPPLQPVPLVTEGLYRWGNGSEFRLQAVVEEQLFCKTMF